MNNITIAGRLGGDPELKTLSGDKVLCKFSIATNRYNGDADWHNVVVWGKTAELCRKYLSKGSFVALSGELQYNTWEDGDGNKRRNAEIVARNVTFGPRPEGTAKKEPAAPAGDDDIPF